MEQFYATFGHGQEYAGCFVEIHAENHHAARAFMLKAHGSRWSSSVYSKAEFDGQVERYGLKRLAVIRQREPGLHPEEAYFSVDRSALAPLDGEQSDG